jgi:hypothetical protein
MIKITEIYEDEKRIRLKIDGKIVDPCIWVLEKLCCHYIYQKRKRSHIGFRGCDLYRQKRATYARWV